MGNIFNWSIVSEFTFNASEELPTLIISAFNISLPLDENQNILNTLLFLQLLRQVAY